MADNDEVLQGLLERKWNMKTFILLLLNDKTVMNVNMLLCRAVNKTYFNGTTVTEYIGFTCFLSPIDIKTGLLSIF